MDEGNETNLKPTVVKGSMLAVGAVGILAVLLISKLWSGSKKEAGMPVPPVAQTPAVAVTEMATLPPGDKIAEPVSDLSVSLEAGSFFYKPNVIRAKVGQRVKVTLSASDMVHNFNIDELSVRSKNVKAGETVVVEFTPDRAGEFEYYCSIGAHRANGQTGVLIVE